MKKKIKDIRFVEKKVAGGLTVEVIKTIIYEDGDVDCGYALSIFPLNRPTPYNIFGQYIYNTFKGASKR